MDEGHKRTEKELAALEKRIAKVYREARDDLQKTVDEYFSRFVERDKHQRDLLKAGEITEDQYRQWRLAQIGRGKRFEDLRDKMAQRYTGANEVAVSYVNDATPGIYSLNRNYAAYTIEQVSDNVDFTLFDEQTVKRLIVEEPGLMPHYPQEKAVKRGIDLAWGKQQITASVTSSILQGRSVGNIANDLQSRIETMNRSSALRTARTAITGAQNAGRVDSYIAAEKMGIKLQKEWLATLDNRTRHSHAMLDGERVPTDKTFPNGCRFPGDPAGPPWEVYNCRCTLVAFIPGVDTSDAQRRARDPETGRNEVISSMTYQEWEAKKKSGKNDIAKPAETATMDKKEPGSGGGTVQTIGRIDVDKYKVVTEKIRTDEVIITDERIQHIKDHHPGDYERFLSYIPSIIEEPDYIVEDAKPKTALVLKVIKENGEYFRLSLRLATPEDNPKYKNSVLTFWKTKEKEWNRILRNKKILYKSE